MMTKSDSARWAGQMRGVPLSRLEATESRHHLHHKTKRLD